VQGLHALEAQSAAIGDGYETSTGRPCPCPYSQGGTCKGQSAWDKPGGAEPRCYRSDVKAEDVKRWREIVKAVLERPKV
jgi:hypothetical protein